LPRPVTEKANQNKTFSFQVQCCTVVAKSTVSQEYHGKKKHTLLERSEMSHGFYLHLTKYPGTSIDELIN